MNLYLDGSMLILLASSKDKKKELCHRIEEALSNGDEILTSVLSVEECIDYFFQQGVDPYPFLESIRELVSAVLSLDDSEITLALTQKKMRNIEFRQILHETIARENHCRYLQRGNLS